LSSFFLNRCSKINETSISLFSIIKVDFHSQKLIQLPQKSFKHKSLIVFQISPGIFRETIKYTNSQDEENENQSKFEKQTADQKKVKKVSLFFFKK